ncbi:hypothetical protein CW751_10520 [Brumimicrobium salinarum]|uniref:PsbP C-terminal domain-containing protein n=1 Tax=Brumimicrobium salinarum TaxID=2058658 RepID=A0A2I0R132_9FLAO|nr:hypothetical protein CW751_10520 [Brumimicrobium salinarum]
MLSLAQNQSTQFDYGKIENNQYQNDYFNFTIDIPEDWFVQNKAQIEALQKQGKQMMAGDDEELNTIFEISEINTANLLSVNKYELGAPVEFNPSFGIVVENISHAPGVKKGSDYLFQVKRLLKQSKMNYEHIDEKFKKTIISGHTFYLMKCEIQYLDVSITQVYYTTITKMFAFSFITTYTDKKQRKELMEIFDSISFKK